MLMDQPLLKATVLTGTKKFEPVEYWVQTQTVKVRKWFRTVNVEQHYVACEFSTMGPYSNKKDAESIVAALNKQDFSLAGYASAGAIGFNSAS